KSETPLAAPRACSPSAARLTSLSRATLPPRARPPRPASRAAAGTTPSSVARSGGASAPARAAPPAPPTPPTSAPTAPPAAGDRAEPGHRVLGGPPRAVAPRGVGHFAGQGRQAQAHADRAHADPDHHGGLPPQGQQRVGPSPPRADLLALGDEPGRHQRLGHAAHRRQRETQVPREVAPRARSGLGEAVEERTEVRVAAPTAHAAV